MSWFRGMSDCPVYWARLQQVAGKVAYDIGANGGETAAIFAKQFDVVQAFEPAVESFVDLVRNVEQHPNVACHRVAISDHTGTVKLREAAESIATGQLVTEESTGWGATLGYRDVPCSTLDDAITMYGIPDLIKIDVEGHEAQVLEGGKHLIAQHAPTLMIEVHSVELGYSVRRVTDRYEHVEVLRHTGYVEKSPEWWGHFYVIASM